MRRLSSRRFEGVSSPPPSKHVLHRIWSNVSFAYKFRFYPTEEQEQILANTFGCIRYAYNWVLPLETDAYYMTVKRLYYKDLSA